MSEVYAKILEVLTVDTYNAVNFAVREYLQNAYDAIKSAQNCGLPEPDEGYHVTVDISRNNRIVTITDNGIGMDEIILKEYTSIGGGTKDDPEYIGHKGIGKLSGLRFFERFVVRTKKAGHDTGFELTWKSGEMIKVLLEQKQRMKKTPYTDFIRDYFDIKKIGGDRKENHFTQVQLIDVTNEFKDQVNESSIGTFIKQNCPVPYNGKRFKHADKIVTWLGNDLIFFRTFINDKIVYQIYDDEFSLVEPKLFDLKYNDKIRAKVWFSWVKGSSEIVQNEAIRGIRFRCKGMCVGNNTVFANKCMAEGRAYAANWFTGEVMVLDDDIKPNAARDGFREGTDTWRLFNELKKNIGKELSMIANVRSEINTATGDLAKYAQAKKTGRAIAKFLNKMNGDVKTLTNRQKRDKYGFDFGVIAELQNVLSREEKESLAKLPEARATIEKAAKEGDTEKLLNGLLNIKEEEVNTYSPSVKQELRKDIRKITQTIVHDKSANKKLSEEEPEVEYTLIISIIEKYLDSKKIKYDSKEIERFVKDELKR